MPPSVAAPPTHYQFRIHGRLDDHWAAWFGAATLTHDGDGTTTWCGPVSDQAELHGLLAKIRDLGVRLISVHEIAPTARPIAASDPADVCRDTDDPERSRGLLA